MAASFSEFDPNKLGEYQTSAIPIIERGGQNYGDGGPEAAGGGGTTGHYAIRDSQWGPIMETVMADGTKSYQTARPGDQNQQVTFRQKDGGWVEEQGVKDPGMWNYIKNDGKFLAFLATAAAGVGAAAYAGGAGAAVGGVGGTGTAGMSAAELAALDAAGGAAAGTGTASVGTAGMSAAELAAMDAAGGAGAESAAASGGIINSAVSTPVNMGGPIESMPIGTEMSSAGMEGAGYGTTASANPVASNAATEAAVNVGDIDTATQTAGKFPSADSWWQTYLGNTGNWISKNPQVSAGIITGIGQGILSSQKGRNEEAMLDKRIAADAALLDTRLAADASETEKKRQWDARNFGIESYPTIRWTPAKLIKPRSRMPTLNGVSNGRTT